MWNCPLCNYENYLNEQYCNRCKEDTRYIEEEDQFEFQEEIEENNNEFEQDEQEEIFGFDDYLDIKCFGLLLDELKKKLEKYCPTVEHDEEKQCKICNMYRADSEFLHNSSVHARVCFECAVTQVSSNFKCAFCRETIDNIVKIF